MGNTAQVPPSHPTLLSSWPGTPAEANHQLRRSPGAWAGEGPGVGRGDTPPAGARGRRSGGHTAGWRARRSAEVSAMKWVSCELDANLYANKGSIFSSLATLRRMANCAPPHRQLLTGQRSPRGGLRFALPSLTPLRTGRLWLGPFRPEGASLRGLRGQKDRKEPALHARPSPSPSPSPCCQNPHCYERVARAGVEGTVHPEHGYGPLNGTLGFLRVPRKICFCE